MAGSLGNSHLVDLGVGGKILKWAIKKKDEET
jgi:hypothetical protein